MPVQVASWALDGISFLATDKSLTDHGLSVVAQKDCALWRGLKGDEVCSDYDNDATVAIAAAEQVAPEEENIAALANFDTAAGGADAQPEHVTPSESIADNGERLMISGNRVWTDRPDADQYFVIGSFSHRGNARRLMKKHQALGPAVMASRLDGVEIYRVAIGPFVGEQRRQMQKQLNKAGIHNAWAMRVDPREWLVAGPKALENKTKEIAEVPAPTKRTPRIGENLAETPDVKPEIDQTSEFIDNHRQYVVIGSFSNAENARKLAKAKASLSPRILAADVLDGRRYRVVLGPYAVAESRAVQKQLTETGVGNVWALNLNPAPILSETLLAEKGQGQEPVLDAVEEIAEIPASQSDPAPSSGDEVSWGANLMKNIIDVFRSANASDVSGGVSPLKS